MEIMQGTSRWGTRSVFPCLLLAVPLALLAALAASAEAWEWQTKLTPAGRQTVPPGGNGIKQAQKHVSLVTDLHKPAYHASRRNRVANRSMGVGMEDSMAASSVL
jgi:hypothetical protein